MGFCTAKGASKVIIFDWDDTICPSSFVDRHGLENAASLPVHFQRLFSEIERLAEKVLNEASKYGEVLIITNSDEGWVKFSCNRFFPKLSNILDRYTIISARTRYEKFYPGQPLCWKAAAFAHEVNELYELSSKSTDESSEVDTSFPSVASTDISTSSDESVIQTTSNNEREVISFGDSMEERTAVRIVADQLTSKPKSVMFISLPTPMQILGQLHMLYNHLRFVCEHEHSLDLEISKEQAARSAESYLRKHKLVHSQQEINQLKCLTHNISSEESGDVVMASSSG